MKILILLVTGPRYDLFFSLAQHFKNTGHEVVIAADCRFSIEFNAVRSLGCEILNFEEVFAEMDRNPPAEVPVEYCTNNLNGGLLADFERDLCYQKQQSDSDYYLRLQVALLRFFEAVIHGRGIDLVVYEGVSNAFAYYCMLVCRRRDVPFAGLQNARIPGHFVVVSDEIGYLRSHEQAFKEIRSGQREVPPELRNWSLHYLANEVCKAPDYMRTNTLSDLSLRRRYANVEKIRMAILVLKHSFRSHRHSAWRGSPLYFSYAQFRRKLGRRWRRAAVMRFYRSLELESKYLLYPLHFHPEASTSMQAGAYLNEADVIRTIAFSLPPGYILAVKDHLSAYAFPPVSFYQTLNALPNVRVLSPFEDTRQLIRNAAAIITLTSTVGFEALLLGKKVFLFGKVFYEFHRNVVKIGNPNELYRLFVRELSREADDSDEYNSDFLCAYRLAAHEGALRFGGSESEMAEVCGAVAPVVLNLAGQPAASKAQVSSGVNAGNQALTTKQIG